MDVASRSSGEPRVGPSAAPDARQAAHHASLRERLAGGLVSAAAKPPFPIVAQIRLVLATLLVAVCALTAGGALLLLMAWRQEQTEGLLVGSQTDRLWDVWDVLVAVERFVAIAAVVVGAVWIAVAAINVRRATGRRRNPIFAVAALVFSAAGAWVAGRRVVTPALDRDDWVGAIAGLALQAVVIFVALAAMERLADAAAARHRPFRVAFVTTLVFVVLMQTVGALATIDRTAETAGWGRTGALVLIAAVVEFVAVLAFTEGGRALEEGTANRYELRHRFGESTLRDSGV